MRSRSATTEFMVEDSRKAQETVGVLSLPVEGPLHAEELNICGKVPSWRTRAASSRSEFVIRPMGFVSLTRSAMMSGGQGSYHR